MCWKLGSLSQKQLQTSRAKVIATAGQLATGNKLDVALVPVAWVPLATDCQGEDSDF